MQISLTLNGKKITEEIAADLLLIDFVRNHGCYSVKRGCETSNCGLCTVFLDEKPVLSCSVLAARADGHKVDTLEGLQEELQKGGYDGQTPAAIVYKASWPEERVCRCTVSTLAETAKTQGIDKTALILVGEFLGSAYDRSLLYDPAFTHGYRQGKRK